MVTGSAFSEVSEEALDVSHLGHVPMGQTAGPHPETGADWGLIRSVHQGVVYEPAEGLPRWTQMGREARYFLPLEADRLRGAKTLRQVALRLKQGSPTNALLTDLDALVRKLLAVTRSLHAKNRQLGMVTRDNVLWLGDEVLLLDHGFYAQSPAFKPAWFHEGQSLPADRELWDVGISDQQYRAKVQNPLRPEEDGRLLIRVLQGLALDVWKKDLEKGETLRVQHKTRSEPLWHTLRTLLKDTPSDVLDKLEAHLKAHPLSSHFNGTGTVTNGKKPHRLPLKALALASLVVVGTVAGLGVAYTSEVWPFSRPPVPEPVAGGPDEKGATGDASEDSPATPADNLADTTPAGSLPARAAFTPPEPETLPKALEELKTEAGILGAEKAASSPEYGDRRDEFLQQWARSFGVAVTTFEQEATREAGYQSLKDLRDSLKTARASTNSTPSPKELECIHLLETLRFDLRLPESFRDSLPSP